MLTGRKIGIWSRKAGMEKTPTSYSNSPYPESFEM